MSDAEALAIMANVFDRPAFYTPFHQESSLPAFQQAIEDTIGALNTGVWRTRDGVEIRRIPSVNHLRDPALRAAVGRTLRALDGLRRLFKRRLEDGSIRHCACGQPDCPVFTIGSRATKELNEARERLLRDFWRLVAQ